MTECMSIMADKGLKYMQELKPEEHLSEQEQKQNNDWIKRRSVYDQSDKMKTIEGQHR